MSVTFLLPVFMQELLGFNATQSGVALMPRALAMMVFTPLVGRLYNRFSPRAFVAIGVMLYAVSAYQMSHYTLATTSSGIVSTLIVQGVAFACIFVPLTTVALTSIQRHKLADATGLNSLVRQIGGSLGLAIFATLLPRYITTAKASIGAHVVAGRPEVAARLGMMQQAMSARGGMDLASARMAAERALGFQVVRQATVLTFEKLFLLAGLLFLFVLPLLYFLKAPAIDDGREVDVHVEM
jgi:DHA2 family multidrug resistance protein